jgi:thioredoxin-related protein
MKAVNVAYASALILMLSAVVAASPVAAKMTLVMVEQPGCVYCKRWDDEISAKYPLTDEGKAAPLQRIRLGAPMPDDFAEIAPVAFTPTFVLVEDGQEIGRIAGYPGEDFFWPMLDDLIGGRQP